VARGVSLILKAQVRVDGKLTVWCAQHDAVTLAPVLGRTYEHPSLSGSESVAIVEFLMGVERPGPEITAAIEGAVAWFRRSAIHGLRVVEAPMPGAPHGRDRFAMADPSAPPLWARFYEVATNRPIFSDRDGVIKYSLAEIGIERRTGYSWYGTWPASLLERGYPQWKAALKQERPVPAAKSSRSSAPR
jgi:PelA/Pel-15E family pectate lyase